MAGHVRTFSDVDEKALQQIFGINLEELKARAEEFHSQRVRPIVERVLNLPEGSSSCPPKT